MHFPYLIFPYYTTELFSSGLIHWALGLVSTWTFLPHNKENAPPPLFSGLFFFRDKQKLHMALKVFKIYFDLSVMYFWAALNHTLVTYTRVIFVLTTLGYVFYTDRYLSILHSHSLWDATRPSQTMTTVFRESSVIVLRWKVRKRWRDTACCGKWKFAISSGWLNKDAYLIRMTW